MTGWKFYGRKEELDRLQEMLELRPDLKRTRRFGAYCVMGRRGVGKTELLTEAVKQSKTELPIIAFEFNSREDTVTSLHNLVAGMRKTGNGHLLQDIPEREPYRSDQGHFADTVAHLIGKGAVVSLDEFHHADKDIHGDLVGDIQQMIDGLAGAVNGTRPSGKLLLMGSHQRRMANLFACDQPLQRRMTDFLKLRPWSIRDVMGMAAKQNFLSRPGRFLTLWTAYGGVPRFWERFATDNARASEFHTEADDEAWRRKFIEAERQRLDDNAERFDAYVHASLEERLRLILLMIAHNPRGGMTTNDIANQFRGKTDRLEAAMEAGDFVTDAVRKSAEAGLVEASVIEDEIVKLWQRLEWVVSSSGPLDAGSPTRWRIDDLNSLFQLQMFPELFAHGKGLDDEDISDPGSAVLLRRMHDLEGRTFRRFCAEWLGDLPNMDPRNCRYRVRRGHLFDIDVLAETGEGGNARLLLGVCKRNPGKHDPRKLRRRFNAFLESLSGVAGCRRKDAERQLRLSRRYVAFSPEFDSGTASRLEAKGFECFDIRAMGRKLGIDPAPLRYGTQI